MKLSSGWWTKKQVVVFFWFLLCGPKNKWSISSVFGDPDVGVRGEHGETLINKELFNSVPEVGK
jgi:hypothetical protein